MCIYMRNKKNESGMLLKRRPITLNHDALLFLHCFGYLINAIARLTNHTFQLQETLLVLLIVIECIGGWGLATGNDIIFQSLGDMAHFASNEQINEHKQEHAKNCQMLHRWKLVLLEHLNHIIQPCCWFSSFARLTRWWWCSTMVILLRALLLLLLLLLLTTLTSLLLGA